MKSMTGFGRTETSNDIIKAVVEIKSVNHRFYDVYIKGPRNLTFLEENIKKIVSGSISRGKVDIYYNYENIEESPVEVTFNKNLSDKYVKALEKVNDRYNIYDKIALTDIINLPDILRTETCVESEDVLWGKLEPLFMEATSKLLSMREYEGGKIKTELVGRLDFLEELRKGTEKRAPEVPFEYKERLMKNIARYLDEKPVDEDKIAMEAAVFADKCSVEEELARLESHIIQFRETMESDEPIGRKLDFLIQEMNRETNTIGSKSNDLQITKNVVEMKSELEKIREQVQNIE